MSNFYLRACDLLDDWQKSVVVEAESKSGISKTALPYILTVSTFLSIRASY